MLTGRNWACKKDLIKLESIEHDPLNTSEPEILSIVSQLPNIGCSC